jgi:hypothetical protein
VETLLLNSLRIRTRNQESCPGRHVHQHPRA